MKGEGAGSFLLRLCVGAGGRWKWGEAQEQGWVGDGEGGVGGGGGCWWVMTEEVGWIGRGRSGRNGGVYNYINNKSRRRCGDVEKMFDLEDERKRMTPRMCHARFC